MKVDMNKIMEIHVKRDKKTAKVFVQDCFMEKPLSFFVAHDELLECITGLINEVYIMRCALCNKFSMALYDYNDKEICKYCLEDKLAQRQKENLEIIDMYMRQLE